MAILATNNSTPKELIPAGNYISICYQMIEIGTVKEIVQGKEKIQAKVRIGWELCDEKKVFKEERGEEPCVISKEYTLSMYDGSNLRRDLKSWRGKDFTEEQAKSFDISNLVGVACMLNIIHKPSKDGTKVYEEISGITPVPKGLPIPPQHNKSSILSYDNFDQNKFESLPDFIKNKIKTSLEFAAMQQPNHSNLDTSHSEQVEDELPF